MSDTQLPATQDELKAAIGEATKGIRAELTEERAKRAEFEKQVKEIKAQLDSAKSAEERAAEEKEKAQLESQGKYAEALEKAKSTYEAKLADIQKKVAEKDKAISELMIDSEILRHANEAVKPDQVQSLIKSSYSISVEDGKVVIKTLDGRPVLDEKGQPVTMKGACQQFMAENPHLVKAGTTTGGANTKTSLPGSKLGTDDIDAQITKAREAGNKLEVIKLKAKRDSALGPHSMLSSAGG